MEKTKGRRRIVIFLALTLMLTPLLGGCNKISAGDAEARRTADRIYLGGNIYTVDDRFSKATILVTGGDRILYVGDDEKAARKYAGEKTETVNLDGKTVIPGLIDAHMHFLQLGEQLKNVDIYLKSKEDILAAIQAEALKVKPGEWITGTGWNQEVWKDNRWPTKAELDSVAPENPVILTRADNHAMWVNTKALEVAGVNEQSASPPGGAIQKNSDGTLSGILIDTAMNLVNAAKPPMSDERKIESLMLAQEHLFSYGVTSVCDTGVNVEDLALTRAQYKNGALKVRIAEYLAASEGSDKEYLEKGGKVERGLFDNRFDVAGVKVINDGSLGSRSAALLKEYSDEAGTLGLPRYTDEELLEIVTRCHKAGLQIAMHAIGDAAVKQGLDAYEKLGEANRNNEARHRIEHYQIVTAEDMDRTVALGIIPSMNACHATSDMNMAENRFGAERLKTAYAWRTMLDKGAHIANGTDAPVEPADPFNNFSAAVTRKNAEGKPEEGFQPEQKISRDEALRASTIWAAQAQFHDAIKGSLEVGKLADFAVLDADIMRCEEDAIKDTKVLRTILGGEEVYNSKP